jgi:hypothetical protein
MSWVLVSRRARWFSTISLPNHCNDKSNGVSTKSGAGLFQDKLDKLTVQLRPMKATIKELIVLILETRD